MKKSRCTDSPIMAVLKEAETGVSASELCRTHGISTATFYKWRTKFGGMDVPMVARMQVLEAENRRRTKMYAEPQLSTDLLREAFVKKMVRPSQRREMAQHAVTTSRTTIRHTCATFALGETRYRYCLDAGVRGRGDRGWRIGSPRPIARGALDSASSIGATSNTGDGITNECMGSSSICGSNPSGA
jgi:putative transposase